MRNFLGVDYKEYTDYKKAQAVILPVPYEGTVTYGKGTAKGPDAILDASAEVEMFDEELLEFPEIVINTKSPIKVKQKPEEVIKQVEKEIKKIIKDEKFPVTLGGEHSISVGPVKALKEKNPKLSVLHLDAHADLRETYEGSKFNHACAAKRFLDYYPIVQVGIRSLDEENHLVMQENDIPVFWAKDIHDNNRWFDKVMHELTDDVYITLDLDVFDPSEMPAVGTPEPGGLKYYQIIKFLKEVFKQKNVVGFDVVELAPIEGLTHPNFLAARLVYKMMVYKFYNSKL